jgi:hypothetical protein
MKKHTLVYAISLASLTTIIVSSLEGSAIAQSAGMQCAGSSGDAAIAVCIEAIKKTQEIGSYTIFGGRPGVKNRSTTRRLPITARR